MAVDIGEFFKLGEGAPGIRTAPGYGSIGEVINNIVPNILIVANLILFFFILFGGFTIISNAGNPDKQKEGSQILTTALIGFLIVFGAYWIMGIIKVITGFDFSQSGL